MERAHVLPLHRRPGRGLGARPAAASRATRRCPTRRARRCSAREQRAWLLRTLAASTRAVQGRLLAVHARAAAARTRATAAGPRASPPSATCCSTTSSEQVGGTTLFVTGDTHWTMAYDRDGLFEARAVPARHPDAERHHAHPAERRRAGARAARRRVRRRRARPLRADRRRRRPAQREAGAHARPRGRRDRLPPRFHAAPPTLAQAHATPIAAHRMALITRGWRTPTRMWLRGRKHRRCAARCRPSCGRPRRPHHHWRPLRSDGPGHRRASGRAARRARRCRGRRLSPGASADLGLARAAAAMPNASSGSERPSQQYRGRRPAHDRRRRVAGARVAQRAASRGRARA